MAKECKECHAENGEHESFCQTGAEVFELQMEAAGMYEMTQDEQIYCDPGCDPNRNLITNT